MPREPKAYLHEMRQAAALIAEFTEGQDFEAYAADAMVRAAVERQFEIIGEALGQLAKLDPGTADRIGPTRLHHPRARRHRRRRPRLRAEPHRRAPDGLEVETRVVSVFHYRAGRQTERWFYPDDFVAWNSIFRTWCRDFGRSGADGARPTSPGVRAPTIARRGSTPAPRLSSRGPRTGHWQGDDRACDR